MRVLVILDVGAEAGTVPQYHGLIEILLSVQRCWRGYGACCTGWWVGPSEEFRDAATQVFRRFNADRQAREIMNDLVDLALVCADDFDAALCLGGQGLNGSAGIKDRAGALVDRLLAVGKPVAVIGPAAACSGAEAGNGLLIVGSSKEAPRLAANALLGAISPNSKTPSF